MAEGRAGKLKKRPVEVIQPEGWRERKLKTEQTLTDLWDSIRKTNIDLIRIPQIKEEENWVEKSLKNSVEKH